MAEHESRDDVELAATVSAWLQMGRPLHLGSVGLSVVAWLSLALKGWALASGVAWSLVAVVGVVEWYYAARCAFDARVFAHWAQAPGGPDALRLSSFDRALVALGARGDAVSVRDLPSRAQGARGLLRSQSWCVLAQLVIAVAAVAASILSS